MQKTRAVFECETAEVCLYGPLCRQVAPLTWAVNNPNKPTIEYVLISRVNMSIGSIGLNPGVWDLQRGKVRASKASLQTRPLGMRGCSSCFGCPKSKRAVT